MVDGPPTPYPALEHELLTIGLTGGIASGKSTISDYFREKDIPVIDADKLGHLAYEPDRPAFAQLVDTLGKDLVAADGSIDRRVLGGKVFGNDAEMKKLTDIVWPVIRQLAAEEIASLQESGAGIVVLEAAVMLEAGWEDLVDEIWVVVVDREQAIQRLASRNGLEPDAAAARIDSQLTNEERLAKADVAIENNGSLDELASRFAVVWGALGARAGAGAAGGTA